MGCADITRSCISIQELDEGRGQDFAQQAVGDIPSRIYNDGRELLGLDTPNAHSVA